MASRPNVTVARRRVARIGGLAVLALLGASVRADGQEFLVPCEKNPTTAAVALLQEVERNGVSEEMYESFSSRFKASTTLEQLQASLTAVLRRYGIDRYDRPLVDRIRQGPAVERVSDGPMPGARVSMITSTSRGEVSQEVSFTCEQRYWRVLRIWYGPA